MLSNAYAYYKAGLTATQRDRQLNSLNKEISFVIHHTETQIQFEAWSQQSLDSAGQAFDKTQEIRWWPLEAGYEMLIISDSEQSHLINEGWEPHEALEWSIDDPKKPPKMFLFGTHWFELVGEEKANALGLNSWIQAGVQATLQYPVKPSAEKSIVCVTTRTYRRNGMPCLTRFVAVEADKNMEVSNGLQ